MAIATPDIIKASDIMNLTNESLTTGNIYASGTSATIGTSDNPFNTVYANQYYGTKFTEKYLGGFTLTTSGTTHSLNFDLSSYYFISIYITGWGALPIFLPWSVLARKRTSSTELTIYGQSNNYVQLYFPSSTQAYCKDNLTGGYGWASFFGYN